MSKEYEKLLQDLLNTEEETDVDITPESRLEAYLLALLEKMGGSSGGGGGSGLPVFTLRTPPATDTPLSEEESEELNALFELGTPIILSFTMEDGGMTMSFSVVLTRVLYPVSEGMTARMFSGEITIGGDAMAAIIASVDGTTWAVISGM